MRPAAVKTAAFMTDRRASRGLDTAASGSRIIFDEQSLDRSHGQPFFQQPLFALAVSCAAR
jgi:hypothetical protein